MILDPSETLKKVLIPSSIPTQPGTQSFRLLTPNLKLKAFELRGLRKQHQHDSLHPNPFCISL